ncbi:MAG: hypothetical protein RMA76_02735 [Deltaproteobacteria bacterium]|jgi:hypothetical protein
MNKTHATTTALFALTLAACGGPDYEAELSTKSSNLVFLEPLCNDVFDFVQDPPNGFFTRASISYNAPSGGAQAQTMANNIRNGFMMTASYGVDEMGYLQADEVDIRMTKSFYKPNRYAAAVQSASKVEVMVFNNSSTTVDTTFVPITHCEVDGYYANVIATKDQRTIVLSFVHEPLGGG